MKQLRYALEAFAVYTIYYLFKIMPLDCASASGGFLARTIGPLLATSRKARRNLERALPGRSETEYADIIRGMWDNLGRVLAEYPHLKQITGSRIIYENEAAVQKALKGDAPLFLIGAHMANWELGAGMFLQHFKKELHITYRAPNNPYVDKLLHRARNLGGEVTAYPKERESGRKILSALKSGHHIGMLVDQKYNEGIAIPFFGRDAMTNPVFVQMAQKFKSPVIPAYAVRENGSNFRVIFDEPLELFDQNGAARPLENVIKDTHLKLERHIAAHPEQWLWLHRRWKD